jgi:hypothetical protein
MSSVDTQATQLVSELHEAKTWPEQFKAKLAKGENIGAEVAEANQRIEVLEKRARATIRRLGDELGCVHPLTRAVFKGMADMLIYWHAFRDSLEGEI